MSDEYVQDILDEYEELREEHYASMEERQMKSLEQAKKLGMHIDFTEHPPALAPTELGLKVGELRCHDVTHVSLVLK